MELKKGELRVFYRGEYDEELDNAIGDGLKPFGYEFYASGYNLEEPRHARVRELAFEKKGEGDEGRDK